MASLSTNRLFYHNFYFDSLSLDTLRDMIGLFLARLHFTEVLAGDRVHMCVRGVAHGLR